MRWFVDWSIRMLECVCLRGCREQRWSSEIDHGRLEQATIESKVRKQTDYYICIYNVYNILIFLIIFESSPFSAFDSPDDVRWNL